MWSDKLKLSKQLLRSVTELGFLNPKELQERTLSRIAGGQDIIGIAPQGSGKTTTYILATLAKLKQGFEEAPRALVLVPDKEAVIAVSDQFQEINKNKSIRIVQLYPSPGIEAQMDALAEGADIVVATPDRARAIYLKLGLNLNKIQLFVVDDADQIVKQGMQLPVAELANSIIKCQHLIFSEVLHQKLEKMIEPFMRDPFIIEIDTLEEAAAEVHEQILYQVPNFRSKLNLLKLLLEDAEVFSKVIVFVNTRLTAEKVYQEVKKTLKEEVALLNPVFFESKGFKDISDFRNDETRVLIVANESDKNVDLQDIPIVIHFELPEEKELFVHRALKTSEEEKLAITFATDIELSDVKKIEQMLGQRLALEELPHGLIIEEVSKEKNVKKLANEEERNVPGAAFHEKKASNSKDYNYSSGYKAKLNKKKKH